MRRAVSLGSQLYWKALSRSFYALIEDPLPLSSFQPSTRSQALCRSLSV